MALAELLVSNAAKFSSTPAKLGPMGNLWLHRLVQTRVIVMLPISNAVGYSNTIREESRVEHGRVVTTDPNRDFPYAQDPSQCMVTAVARALNEDFLRHMYQLAITFHGGMQAVAYEWGAPNRRTHNSESPDDAAQSRIAHQLAKYAGSFKRNTYPAGRLNSLVYPVAGGMEDWAYAAGWDHGAVRPCTPTSFGGYPASRTDYANNGHAEALRAYNILVETWDRKRPYESELGTDEAMLHVSGPGDGHVPRNMRIALQLIDVVQPWAQFSSVDVELVSVDPSRRRALPQTCASRRALRAGAQLAGVGSLSAREDSTLRRRPRLAEEHDDHHHHDDTGAAAGSGDPYGLAALPHRSKYQHWIHTNRCDHALKVDLGWDVGGGYTVDSTRLLVGRWPASVSPDELYAAADPNDHPDVAMWKSVVAGGSPTSALYVGQEFSGSTRWMDASFKDFFAHPYTTRFQDCTLVTSDHPTPPPPSGVSDIYARVDTYLALAVSRLDSDWAHQQNPTPGLQPQSHLVNARTNPAWDKTNSGFRIVGRTHYISDPQFIAVAALKSGCAAASPPSPSPSPSSSLVSSPSPAAPEGEPQQQQQQQSETEGSAGAPDSDNDSGSDKGSGSGALLTGTPVEVPHEDAGTPTSFLEAGERVKVKAPRGLVVYAVVVTLLLVATLVAIVLRSRSRPGTRAAALAARRGEMVVTPAFSGAVGWSVGWLVRWDFVWRGVRQLTLLLVCCVVFLVTAPRRRGGRGYTDLDAEVHAASDGDSDGGGAGAGAGVGGLQRPYSDSYGEDGDDGFDPGAVNIAIGSDSDSDNDYSAKD